MLTETSEKPSFEELYYKLLEQYNSYKQQSISQKEQLKAEIEKCKLQFDKFTSKLDKKLQSKLSQEKKVYQFQLDNKSKFFQDQIENFEGTVKENNITIDFLRTNVKMLEQERKKLIDGHTQILLQIHQDLNIQGGGQKLQMSYKQLVKMYQYLLEQNNQVKKENMKLQKLTTFKSNESHQISNKNALQTSVGVIDNSSFTNKNKSLRKEKKKVKAK